MDRAEVHFVELQNPRISDREVCEVTLEGPGRRVRAKAAASDTFAAIDLAVDKLEHQLVSLKSKIVRTHHGGRRASVLAEGLSVDDDLEAELVIEA